jgi:hypothetical protein
MMISREADRKIEVIFLNASYWVPFGNTVSSGSAVLCLVDSYEFRSWSA